MVEDGGACNRGKGMGALEGVGLGPHATKAYLEAPNQVGGLVGPFMLGL